MADKIDEGQNVKDSDHGKSAGDDKSLKTETNETKKTGDIEQNRDEIEKTIQEELGPDVTLDPQNDEQLDQKTNVLRAFLLGFLRHGQKGLKNG